MPEEIAKLRFIEGSYDPGDRRVNLRRSNPDQWVNQAETIHQSPRPADRFFQVYTNAEVDSLVRPMKDSIDRLVTLANNLQNNLTIAADSLDALTQRMDALERRVELLERPTRKVRTAAVKRTRAAR